MVLAPSPAQISTWTMLCFCFLPLNVIETRKRYLKCYNKTCNLFSWKRENTPFESKNKLYFHPFEFTTKNISPYIVMCILMTRLDINWKIHITNEDLYVDLLPISKRSKIERLRFADYHAKNESEVVFKVLQHTGRDWAVYVRRTISNYWEKTLRCTRHDELCEG